MTEPTKNCFNIQELKKIPKSSLNAIIDRYNNPKEKKEKVKKDKADTSSSTSATNGKGKSRTQAKDFEVQVTPAQRDDYSKAVARIKHEIGTLLEPRFCNLGVSGRVALCDSLTGAPCKFFFFSIPTEEVGKQRAQNIQGGNQLFLGTFNSELSMFCYLLKIVKLPRDHPIVQQTAEYYGVKLADKYSDATLQDHINSLEKSKISNFIDSLNPVPFSSQLGRSVRSLKNVFFYRNRSVEEYDNTRKYFDGQKFLREKQILRAQFYDYADFVQADNAAKRRKQTSQSIKKQWTEHISKVGPEQALIDFDLLKNERAQNRLTGIKRPVQIREASDSIKKPRIEENNNNNNTPSDHSTDLSGDDNSINMDIFLNALSKNVSHSKDYYGSDHDEFDDSDDDSVSDNSE